MSHVYEWYDQASERISNSVIEWLFLPFFRVKSDEGVVCLHLHPTHFVCHIHPTFRLEELGSTELRTVVWHVVEHVEEDGVRENADSRLGQTLGLRHVVALRDTDVHLETVIVVGIT